MAQQTAVEWLVNEINKMNVSREATLFINRLKDQAKQMEKEQIVDAFKHGELSPLFVNYNAEEYYNKTFGNK